jgi:hypothetical protein
MLSKNIRPKNLYTTFRMFSATIDRPDIFMDIKKHGFLPNSKPMQELPKPFGAMNEILDDMTFW